MSKNTLILKPHGYGSKEEKWNGVKEGKKRTRAGQVLSELS